MIHIVLFEPLIPQNTGNIMRTAIATGSFLHLIEPLGFKLDEKSLKRSGVNYISEVKYDTYKSWDDFYSAHKNKGQFYFFTRYAKASPKAMEIKKGIDYYLVFGKETTGIDKNILCDHPGELIRIPMKANVRTLNLAVTVGIGCYYVLDKLGYPELSTKEVLKGEDFLEKEKEECDNI